METENAKIYVPAYHYLKIGNVLYLDQYEDSNTIVWSDSDTSANTISYNGNNTIINNNVLHIIGIHDLKVQISD